MQQNIAHNLDEKPRTRDILVSENFDFSSFLLLNTTLEGLNNAGFFKPSPIQLKAIPLGRCGLDLIVQAKSGTGKTAVFTIIALEMVKTTTNAVQVLIFAPTREIAVQIEDVIRTIGKQLNGLQVGSFIGGLPLEDDLKKLKHCHIAVGAPGRLRHLIEAGRLKTDSIRLLVLDEADKLMESSLQNDINFVYSKLPERKQIIALSATYPDQLDKFLENYMQTPTSVTHEGENLILLGLRQFVSVVKSHLNVTRQLTIKNDELNRLLSKISFTQCLIFLNSQLRVESISNILKEKGWNTTSVSASQSQTQRLKAINSLKNFKCRILLSTDLTARGIDAANVDLVINYDIPLEAATYLHRMGRAGRYGSHGICVTIAANGIELKKFQNIIGEIGGTEFSVAKLPGGDSLVHDVWKSDLNVFESVYGTIGNKETDYVDLQESVLTVKANKLLDSNLAENDQLNLHSFGDALEETDKVEEDITMKLADVDTGSILKALASGKNFMEEEQPGKKEEDDLVSPALLYPWVPVEEGCSVLMAPKKTDNLLADYVDSSDENMPSTSRDNLKRKRKQCKSINSSSDNLVPVKNIALFHATRLLTVQDDSALNAECYDALGNYFNALEQQDDLGEVRKYLEKYTCDDLLKNIAHHTQQCSRIRGVEVESADPDDIAKLSFDFMLKGAIHWKIALGVNYEPEEVDLEDEENMDYFEAEEEEEEVEEEVVVEERVHSSTNYRDGFQDKWQPAEQNYMGNIATAGGSSANYTSTEHEYNPQYSSYFRHYTDMLDKDVQTFEDVASFDNYFAQFMSNMESVRNYVQQNIYVQEMAKYQNQSGQF